MRSFYGLKVWHRAHLLTLAVYAATAPFPRAELYGLTSQLRRSASSIPANIAEGCGRYGTPELIRFLHIASGSASELEYHLLLAHDLKLLESAEFARLSNDVSDVKRMLAALCRKLAAES